MRPVPIAIVLAVFASGAAALIFQLAWLYECGLVFGNSVWAASLVLSSFMAGLACGNALVLWASARVRIHRPLLTYGVLEAIVAVSGIALTYTLPHLTSIVAWMTTVQTIWLMNAVRFILAFAILVVPTTAMGATFPVVVVMFERPDVGFGPALGRLYGWNTLGAVLGVMAAELVLVGRVGVKGSAWVAASLDLGASAIACGLYWCLAGRVASALRSPDAVRSSRLGGYVQRSFLTSWRLLAAAFLAGGALLSLEIVWFRFLTLYVLSTTLAASLMLAVVLAAIALGGLVASRWLKRSPDAVSYLAAVALLGGCTVVAAYDAFQWTTAGTQIAAWYRVLWITVALAGPTSFVSGLLYTLLGESIARHRGNPTQSAAVLTLSNTAGAMTGPLIAAFLLLPAVGVQGAVLCAAAVYVLAALLVWRGAELGRAPYGGTAMAACLAVLILACLAVPVGAMRDRYFVRAAQPYVDDGSTIAVTREGPSETILLMQQNWMGGTVYHRLVTNGFSMSGTAVPGARYMRYFAYWPLLLHQTPLKRALVVCYGAGVTAQAVTDIDSLDSIDIVELSADMVAMSDVIYRGARHPLHDPRVRVHIDDGRAFLQATHDRFDLITGEPPPARTPGAVTIYTREYFQLIHDHLADGGMVTYWVPVARPNPGTDVDTIIRAFCDVFDDCSLWNGTPFDLMLVGTNHARGPVSLDTFSRPWVTPGLESRFRDVAFERPEQIGATFIGDAAYLHDLTRTTPPLVDDYPQRLLPVPGRPSLSDPRYRTDPAVAAWYQTVIDPDRARQRFADSAYIRQLWPEGLVERSLPAFEEQRVLNRVYWEGGKPLRQIEDLHWTLTTTTLRTLPLWILGSDEVKQRIAEGADDSAGVSAYARGLRALAGRDYQAAAAYLSTSDRQGFTGGPVRPLMAYALCRAGQVDAARSIAAANPPRGDDEQHFWSWMATTFGVRPQG